ncbi:MAG: efflux RND transporter permease subunit [Paludibacteraceae bacterium]
MPPTSTDSQRSIEWSFKPHRSIYTTMPHSKISLCAHPMAWHPSRSSSLCKKTYDPLVKKRFNLYTSIPVNGDIAPSHSSGQAINAILRTARTQLPQGYRIDFSGILFVYLILAALYNSFLLPLAILLTIPCGLAGAFLLAQLLHLQNDIYFQLGAIMLIGLLAKTAILLTDYAAQCRQAGIPLTQAAALAAKARLRPILMTALTMLAGMIPMLAANGVGANGNKTIAAATIGGEMLGTLALLFIVPPLFVALQQLHERRHPITFQPSDDPLINRALSEQCRN